MTPIEENIKYIKKGKIGCTFAAVAARNPNKYGWYFISINSKGSLMGRLPKNTTMISLIFPHMNLKEVRIWALANGMWEEEINEEFIGLRIKGEDNNTAWVTYMGEDSHCATRTTPHSMLTWRVAKPEGHFYRVSWKNILHVAHLAMDLALFKMEKMWESSHEHTKRIIGHYAGEKEAAKVSYLKSDI